MEWLFANPEAAAAAEATAAATQVAQDDEALAAMVAEALNVEGGQPQEVRGAVGRGGVGAVWRRRSVLRGAMLGLRGAMLQQPLAQGVRAGAWVRFLVLAHGHSQDS